MEKKKTTTKKVKTVDTPAKKTEQPAKEITENVEDKKVSTTTEQQTPVTQEPLKQETVKEEKVAKELVKEEVTPVKEPVKEEVTPTKPLREEANPVQEPVKEEVNSVKEEKVAPVSVEPVIIAPVINQVAKPLEEKAQPAKVLKEKRSTADKFALFFIIIGFIAMAVAFIPLVSALFLALYYLILIFLMVITLLTLLLNEDFKEWLNGGEVISNVINSVLPYCPYVFGGAIGMFVISLVLYCFSKKKARKIAGIVLTILFTLLSVVGIVLTANIH